MHIYYVDTTNNTIYAPFIAGMRTRSPAFSSVPVGDSFADVSNKQSTFLYKIEVSLQYRGSISSGYTCYARAVHRVWA